MNRNAVIIVACLVAFWLGRFTAPTIAPASTDDAKQKLQSLLDSDYTDYQRLKTLQEKYQKADEILGKMMVIFLADLQLRLPKAASTTGAVQAQSSVAAPAVPTSTPAQSTQATAIATVPAAPARSAPDMNVRQVRDEEQAKQLLDSKRKDNLQSSWAGAAELKAYPRNLEGCFTGMYVPDDSNSESAPMSMFHKIISGKEAQSTVVVNFKAGHNRTRGNGQPKGYRQGEGGAILLESGDWIYELFFLPSLDGWAGNVYKKQKDESRTPLGKVMLARGGNCEQ